ncbi:hypothetical protein ACIRG5_47060 [Lentzea sp. NPDC102401]|uniref:hypothetical protein n=1 Tax=Lentzea sp. NPDC102401 TaxID=3364128 RepID=UPI00380BB892
MTHNTCSPRTAPRRARWQRHWSRTTEVLRESPSPHYRQHHPAAVIAYWRWFDATAPATAGAPRTKANEQLSDPLTDVAPAMAVLGSAVDNGRVYDDERACAREYFAETTASELAEGILVGVVALPHPAPDGVRSLC